MFDADLFHSKIIYTEGKRDGPPFMLPKSWGDGALAISICNQTRFKELLCNDTSLRKTIHTFLNPYIDVSIRSCQLPKVVEFDEFLGYVGHFQSHELWVVHGCVEVEIFDVNCHESYPMS